MRRGNDLLLSEFRPVTSLRLPVHEVERPLVRAIDAHNHLGPIFGGDWPGRSVNDLLAVLDEAGVDALVNLDGGFGPELSREVQKWQDASEGRILVFAGLDYQRWSIDPHFGETEAELLRESAARGARGLKVWKTLGLRVRDTEGRLITVDDERLDSLWSAAAELKLPVIIHVADPIAFFQPLDSANERWEELHAHPEWHYWPPLATESPVGERGFPSFDSILLAFGRLLARHEKTTFIGAHVGCAAEDLALVARMLDSNPNYHVDIAARLAEIGRQPHTSRAFFIRYADRILFGTDEPPDPAAYRIHYRFLETFDESFDYGTGPLPTQGRWQIHGIGLPGDVLRKVYRENARRVLRLEKDP
jgi:predicted TIM-barrel fold metal-dependent hydrolase